MGKEFDYIDILLISLLLLPKNYQLEIVDKLLKDLRGGYNVI